MLKTGVEKVAMVYTNVSHVQQAAESKQQNSESGAYSLVAVVADGGGGIDNIGKWDPLGVQQVPYDDRQGLH